MGLCGKGWLNPTPTTLEKEQKFIETNAAITINIQFFKQLLDNLEQQERNNNCTLYTAFRTCTK
jgi:hypothetical protein